MYTAVSLQPLVLQTYLNLGLVVVFRASTFRHGRRHMPRGPLFPLDLFYSCETPVFGNRLSTARYSQMAE